jgi:uncharacterized repeat protein (TIGR01451 family)
MSSPTSLTSCFVEYNYGDGTRLDTAAVFSYGGTNYVSYKIGHSFAVAGTYTIKHVLICGGNRLDSISRPLTVACSYIGGVLYHDVNTNCVYNSTENLTSGPTTIEIDSAGTKIDTLQAWGYWWYRVRATSTTVYRFKVLAAPTGFTTSCPASGVITYTYSPTVTPVAGQDFGFNCSVTPAYDYSLAYSRVLRGASSSGPSFINLMAANTSCHTGTSTVTLNVSPKYNINTSGISPAPLSVVGNTVTWNLSGLSYGYRQLYVPLTPKSTTANGDTACNYAIIMPTAGDANATNNVVSVCDSVRASWDPNEKAVSPVGEVNGGTTLSYTIDFENLGNDTAFNIRVEDTLSQHLEPGTFLLLGATHNVVPYMYEISGGRFVIKFDFPGINLEDKNVPERNKGQVRFSIRTKQGLPAGTVVQNRAGIYFDGNTVVLTNYAYSQIPFPTGILRVNVKDGVQVFPNPANDVLNIHISTEGWNEAMLSNSLGQIIRRVPLLKGGNVLDMLPLPPGIYYLQVRGSAGTTVEKVEKS